MEREKGGGDISGIFVVVGGYPRLEPVVAK